jgi:hypothetical protein
MTAKLTVTKIAQASGGMLKDDQHRVLETFELLVPDENVALVTAGQIVKEKRPTQYLYTLIRDENKESIVFASQSGIKNPWADQNLIIQIFGEVKAEDGTVEAISEWNYNKWQIINTVTYGEYVVTNVSICSLQKLEENRYVVLAEITINDKNNVVFGDDYIASRSGYILLHTGLTKDGPQEIDLVTGNEIQDCAIIVEKIETE